MDPPSDEGLFRDRALILGATDTDAGLWATIATKRGWTIVSDQGEFDHAVLTYLAELGAGETWTRDLERLLEASQPGSTPQ